MARMALEDGIRGVVLTPHQGIPLAVFPAAEVHLCADLAEQVAAGVVAISRALDMVRGIAGPRAEDMVSRCPEEILGGQAISPWEPIPPPAGETEEALEKETENDNPGY